MGKGIADSVLDAIGDTPIVRLSRLEPDLDRELLVKLELLNPGGSHKVRIALNMILEAEKDGELVRGALVGADFVEFNPVADATGHQAVVVGALAAAEDRQRGNIFLLSVEELRQFIRDLCTRIEHQE